MEDIKAFHKKCKMEIRIHRLNYLTLLTFVFWIHVSSNEFRWKSQMYWIVSPWWWIHSQFKAISFSVVIFVIILISAETNCFPWIPLGWKHLNCGCLEKCWKYNLVCGHIQFLLGYLATVSWSNISAENDRFWTIDVFRCLPR